MDIGSWIKQNKLAAGGIAAGAGFLFLSTRGRSTQSTGVLTPVATAYPNEDMAPTEEAASAADSAESASAAAEAAQQAADDAANSVSDVTEAEPTAPAVMPSPLAPNPPTPSSLQVTTAPRIETPAPPPQVVPQTFPLPGDYVGGLPFGQRPGNLGMLIGNVLGFKNVGGGSNSNGSYTTFRFASDLGNTGDWNFYSSGAKKGQWVGPFNFPGRI